MCVSCDCVDGVDGDLRCLRFGECLAETLVQGVSEALGDMGDVALLLSGGIDTTFTAVALSEAGIRPVSITVTYGDAPDSPYAVLVARKLNLSHTTIDLSKREDLLNHCLGFVVKVLRTIDPIEVVCDVPVCAGLVTAVKMGLRRVLTGDGGDELFLGYSFLLRSDGESLREWLNRVEGGNAWFPAPVLGKALGLRVVPALYTGDVRRFASRVPLECRIGVRDGVRWGKYLMRLYLESRGFKEVAWRSKTPVNMGSGVNEILKEWASMVGDEDIARVVREAGFEPPSRQHAYLYKVMVGLGAQPPEPCSDERSRCPVCGRCLQGRHCRFCGASLDRGGQIMVFTGDYL